jgi:hypothetical protein
LRACTLEHRGTRKKIPTKQATNPAQFNPTLQAEPCFSACCDLRKTCHALTSPVGLAAMGSRLTVGQPFTPMLSRGFNGANGKGQLAQCELAMKKNKCARGM